MTYIAFFLLFLYLLVHPAVGSSSSSSSKEEVDQNGECSKLNFENCENENCDEQEEKYVICYFTNWAWYRSAPVNFRPENINASLCTHIFYAFSSLNTSTLQMVPSDSWADIDSKFFELVTAFKEKGLKVLLSIGGWNNSGGSHWSKLVNNATARAEFVTAAGAFLQKYNFDGLDLDYEYPGCPQGNLTAGLSTDKDNFNVLVSELKTSFNGELLVTVTTAGGEKLVKHCYNMAELCQLADWINVMAYDYSSYLDGQTAANAPICGTGSTWGVYETIKYYQKVIKCPAKKLVLGLPFYGQTYQLADSTKPQFGVAVKGAGTAGTYTKNAGTLAYYEICLNLNNGWKSGFSKINDSYAYSEDQFVSYDSASDIKRKSCLINKYFKLKGAMFWNLDYDDFNDICDKGSYPLLKTLNQQLRCLDCSDD